MPSPCVSCSVEVGEAEDCTVLLVFPGVGLVHRGLASTICHGGVEGGIQCGLDAVYCGKINLVWQYLRRVCRKHIFGAVYYCQMMLVRNVYAVYVGPCCGKGSIYPGHFVKLLTPRAVCLIQNCSREKVEGACDSGDAPICFWRPLV